MAKRPIIIETARPLVSGVVVAYLIFGILYQYLVYGDAPMDRISTWFHVLFWFWIFAYNIFYYIAVFCVIVIIFMAIVDFLG